MKSIPHLTQREQQQQLSQNQQHLYKQIIQAIKEVVAEAPRLAREAGFIVRERKIDGAGFFSSLVFGWLEKADATLDELTQVFQACHIAISSPGLSKRFTPEAARFMRAMGELLTQKVIQAAPVEIGLLRRFCAVIVEDSSSVVLPASLVSEWQGCGGSGDASPSAVKLHTRLDLLSGHLQGPLLSNGRLPDSRSPFKALLLVAGSLFLADLGYFDLQWLKRQAMEGAYWIMRLKSQTVLLTKHGAHRLDVKGLLPTQIGQVVEYGVLVGADARLPARLILVRVPDEVAQQRRERLEEEATDRGETISAEQWHLAQWTIIITNAPATRLTTLEVLRLTRIRWQIELLFKLWKDEGQIDEWRSKKPWRILCEFYGKLAAMVVQHWLLLLGCWHDPYRSLVKAAQAIQKGARRLLAALMGDGSLVAALRALVRSMRSGCRVSHSCHRPCTAQILLEELNWPGLLLS